jgi:hypothetical protein
MPDPEKPDANSEGATQTADTATGGAAAEQTVGGGAASDTTLGGAGTDTTARAAGADITVGGAGTEAARNREGVNGHARMESRSQYDDRKIRSRSRSERRSQSQADSVHSVPHYGVKGRFEETHRKSESAIPPACRSYCSSVLYFRSAGRCAWATPGRLEHCFKTAGSTKRVPSPIAPEASTT